MSDKNSLLEAMYTMLYIELFVHGDFIGGSEEDCQVTAMHAAKTAVEYFFKHSKEKVNDE